jgi:exopolysaccharide production protein ExoZ
VAFLLFRRVVERNEEQSIRGKLTQLVADKQEYYGLQVLRAIAALAVVAGHSTDFLAKQNGSIPWELSWIHGPAGVDIFFVISGFVMMYSAGGLVRRPPPGNFLVRRFVRIIPLYWLLTAVKLALMAWRPQLAEHARPSLWNAVSSFLFIPSIGAAGEIRPVIPVGWTLSFEMAFYLIFAIGLAGSGRVLRFLTPTILAVGLVGVFRTSAWPVWTAVVDPIVLEFLAGVWIAHLARLHRLPSRAVACVLVPVGFLSLALLTPAAASWTRVLTWGIGAVLIVAGTAALEDGVSLRFPKWLLLLGDASYSIYLIQTFLLPVIHLGIRRFLPGLPHQHPVEAGILLIGVSCVVIAGAGVVVHRLIEKPMTVWLRQVAGASRPVAVTP